MNLKQLSDEKLEQDLVNLFEKERALLCVIIQYVMEVQRRKKHLDTNQKLFKYLQKISKYSHGTTQRRLDAAMLALEIPELLTAVKAGTINSGQIVIVQAAFRLSAKLKKQKVSKDLKIKILKSIEDKTADDSQVIAYSMLDIKPKIKVKTRKQADGSVRVETTFSKEQWETLETAKEFLSHSVPTGNFVELVTYMSERVIAHKVKTGRGPAKKSSTASTASTEQTAKTSSTSKAKDSGSEVSDSPTTENKDLKIPNGISCDGHSIPDCNPNSSSKIPNGIASPGTKLPNGIAPQPQAPKSKGFVQTYKIRPARTAIPAAERRAAFEKSDCCQHKDKITGEICGSRWQLQPDHIQPLWAGGSNKAENLQIMCAVHNRARYQRQAGIRPSARQY